MKFAKSRVHGIVGAIILLFIVAVGADSCVDRISEWESDRLAVDERGFVQDIPSGGGK